MAIRKQQKYLALIALNTLGSNGCALTAASICRRFTHGECLPRITMPSTTSDAASWRRASNPVVGYELVPKGVQQPSIRCGVWGSQPPQGMLGTSYRCLERADRRETTATTEAVTQATSSAAHWTAHQAQKVRDSSVVRCRLAADWLTKTGPPSQHRPREEGKLSAQRPTSGVRNAFGKALDVAGSVEAL